VEERRFDRMARTIEDKRKTIVKERVCGSGVAQYD
jgi:hypothetical protein